ncbi:ubiquitin carboxyl-terminal hydrolase 14 [Hylaeus anthracinus]|uniref:ubiquitin carboxyl-terminal hydrolase 14 n=1 Tax=Hylaeus volcanicus TaxID=313075 RepID=UPI0023B85717|nr:ubiquitin carboxyl-terminal hydrolase 14 [Hylaeus volcanicus]XP_054012953.1 ubiquitin carboxyl-terminal hydrolase 14 [Hylaeus anthracinus]
MPQYLIKVKWGKELFPDVEVNTDEEPMLFKAQLFALTGVQPERQKVMMKGMTLKDDNWGNIKLKDGITVLMMGSKEEDVPVEPTEKPLFLEDMNESELATALDLPAGLTNLGNTCYLNATVQCLKTVPELRDALKHFSGGFAAVSGTSLVPVPAQSITAALRDLYDSMDKGSSLPPVVLVQMMHLAFPRFAEKSEHGGFQQQDANECWTEIIRMLQQKLPAKDNPATSDDNGKNSKPRSLIEQYFGGTFDTELKCVESEDEPPTKGKEEFLQLSCFISTEVKYMHSGLRNKMQEQITKMSSTLGRDAVYTKTSKISRLPAYLTIQFVRFYYKEKEAINAKILKDVKFPLEFDAFELCSSELQSKLTPMREKFKEYEDSLVEESRNVKDNKNKGNNKKMKQLPFWFPDDLGSNNSGYYTLQAVLTHRGRSSSSGHYVAWVRQKNDIWLKCDDEIVSSVTSEEVLRLSGGGDWHCAYVLLYGPKVLEIPDTDNNEDSNTK